MKMTVKKGDTVLVIAGKDKGKTGKVVEVFPDDNKVLVDGLNIVTKHQKARKQDEKSAIVKKSAPMEASNVMVVCPVCGKATRVAHKDINGKKARVCKKCSASLDKEFVKATKKEAKKNIASTKTETAEKEVKKSTKTAEKTTATKTQKSKTDSSAKTEA
jgi:large subunit ribosomal protein L24